MIPSVATNKYAILIGINGYHESLGRLKYCVNDVRRLAAVLTQGEDAFPKDRLLVLTDDGEQDKCPTYANIHSWLASYLAQADDDDTVFVYFAGHGREHGGKAYLLPSDATLQTVHVTGIPVSYVQELLERCKARQKVLVLDACHSGAGRDVAAMSTGMLNELSGGKGIYTITSCDASELSHEWAEKEHGVFSYFLSAGLSGGCLTDLDGRLTADSVYAWVYDRVRGWALEHRCRQTPKRVFHGEGSIVLSQIRVRESSVPVDEVEESILAEIRRCQAQGDIRGGLERAQKAVQQFPLSYAIRKTVREMTEALRAQQSERAAKASEKKRRRVERLAHDAKRFESEGDIETALSCLREAVSCPEGVHLQVLLESLERRAAGEMSPREKAAELKRLFKQAQEVKRSDIENAVTAYERILSLHPGNEKAKKKLDATKEQAALNGCRNSVSKALHRVTAQLQAAAETCASLEAEKNNYLSVGMRAEGERAGQELRALKQKEDALSQKQCQLKRLIEYLKRARRLSAAQKSIAENIEKYSCLVGMASEPSDNEELTVLDHVAPDLKKARDEVWNWKEEVLSRAEKGLEEYRKACVSYEEKVAEAKRRAKERTDAKKARESERLHREYEEQKEAYERELAEYERTPKWLKLFATRPVQPIKAKASVAEEKPRRIDEPERVDFFALPSPPDAIQQLRPACVSDIPEEIWELICAEHRWLHEWHDDRPKERRAEVASASLADYLGRSAKGQESRGLLEKHMRLAGKALIAAAKEDARRNTEVNVRGLGCFWYRNRPRRKLVFRHDPKTKSTSRTFRSHLHQKCGFSKPEVERVLSLFQQVSTYCAKHRERIMLPEFGVFFWDSNRGLSFESHISSADSSKGTRQQSSGPGTNPQTQKKGRRSGRRSLSARRASFARWAAHEIEIPNEEIEKKLKLVAKGARKGLRERKRVCLPGLGTLVVQGTGPGPKCVEFENNTKSGTPLRDVMPNGLRADTVALCEKICRLVKAYLESGGTIVRIKRFGEFRYAAGVVFKANSPLRRMIREQHGSAV